MKSIPYIPETAPFSPEQRAWLNGFLAGLLANATPPDTPAVASPPAEPLLILFGSQTGTAEGLAGRIAKEARQRGFAPQVLPLNDCQPNALALAAKAIIISSTWGEGDPPDNAANFWSWLNSEAAPRLEQLHFGVLGLGDKNYPDFCGASKKFDDRFEALGARRLLPRGECDVEYEAVAKDWLTGLWLKLSDGKTPPSLKTNGHPVAEKAPAFGKANPFPARLLRNICLNKPGSSKEVRHHEISLEGSGLAYEAGDALGVLPANCPVLVDEVIAALHCSGDEWVKVGENEMPLRDALLRQLDITKPALPFLETIARRAPGCELLPLLAAERAADLKQWLWG
ncbi:MAG TPA: flavodoxin domain-containing protein, partial [Candidatus Saccharimonadales bacterium]|nr:flavodoxin domain-containing protein [Candidatus Saccharimonadales bacterium]